jgi:type IV pilus assembly protein PilQ
MTFFKTLSQNSAQRRMVLRACALGLALAVAGSGYATQNPAVFVDAQDPLKKVPAVLAVTKIDFKRSDDGAGRLILQFDGQGASPDLQTQGANVVVDVSNARVPPELRKPLNVVDFATPVQRIEPRLSSSGTQLILATKGAFESLAYQSGNEYVVEIAPRKDEPLGVPNAKTVSKEAGKLAKRGYAGKPVNFNFQDVPVRTVLQLIAEESNLNVVASDTVIGNVTLRLVNVPWDQALEIVLRAKGLDQRRDSNVIWVAPQAELAKYEQSKEDARIAIESRVGLVTDYIQVNYHSAKAIFDILTEAKGIGGGSDDDEDSGFLSGRGRLVADERSNILMVSDIPTKVAQMRELIDRIDRPVDQVVIESRIVVASDTFARDLGAKFGIGGTHQYGDNTATVGSSITGNANASRSINFDGSGNTYTTSGMASVAYTLLGENFNLELELSAMQEEGRGEIVSNPRIVTSNQRAGMIKQGQEVGYVTYTTSSTSGTTSPTVEFKDVVLELKVTPTITDDNRVSMDINVTKDDVASWQVVEGYGSIPLINTRELNTAVLVDDGQTVVVGGIYELTDMNSVSKVPFLGDIPFLGNLFKKQGRQKDKAELLIFITPKVMKVAKRA